MGQRLSLQMENGHLIETNDALIIKGTRIIRYFQLISQLILKTIIRKKISSASILGAYNEKIDVSIKIFWNHTVFDHELKILRILGVTNTNIHSTHHIESIEGYGILPVHYHGKFLSRYFAIAMTSFDETLEDRFKTQTKHNQKMTELDIMLLYKRAINILHYIHGKKVDHNAINSKNIFLRGPNVFIGSKHFFFEINFQ